MRSQQFSTPSVLKDEQRRNKLSENCIFVYLYTCARSTQTVSYLHNTSRQKSCVRKVENPLTRCGTKILVFTKTLSDDPVLLLDLVRTGSPCGFGPEFDTSLRVHLASLVRRLDQSSRLQVPPVNPGPGQEAEV